MTLRCTVVHSANPHTCKFNLNQPKTRFASQPNGAPEITSYMRAVLLAQPRMAKRVQGDSATHSTPPVVKQKKATTRQVGMAFR